MCDGVEHHINTLLLDEELVDVGGGAASVAEAEAGKNILLVDVPEIRVVVDALGRDREKLGLGAELDLRVRDDPLLLGANLHESQLLDVTALVVENGTGGASAVDGKRGADQGAASLALDLAGGPDAEDGADGKVALDDRAAVDRVKRDEVLSVLVQLRLLGHFLGGAGRNNLRLLKMLGDDLVSLNVDVGLQLAELIALIQRVD